MIVLSPTRRFTAVYGLAHGGKTLFWAAGDVYFAFYITAVCGLSAWSMALVLGLSYLFNAVADIVVGKRLGRIVHEPLDAARIQFAGAVASAAALLLFALAGLAPQAWRLIACLVTLLLFRAAYAFYDNPQNSLLTLVARDDDRRRATLAAARNVSGGLAKTLMAASFVPLLVGRTREVQAHAFLLFAGAIAAVAIVTAALLRYRLDGAGDDPAPIAPVDRPIAAQGVAMPLFAMMFVCTLATTIFMQLEPYAAAYVIPARAQAATMMICVTLGSVVSQPAWAAWADRIGMHKMLDRSMMLTAFGAVCFLALVLRGPLAAGFAGLVYGIGMGGIFLALWAEAARYARARRHRHGETATIGLFTGIAKIAQALAVIGIAWLLDSFRRLDSIGGEILLFMAAAPLLGVLCMLALPRFQRHPLPLPADTAHA